MYVYVLKMFAGRFQTNPNNVIEYLVDVSMVKGRKIIVASFNATL